MEVPSTGVRMVAPERQDLDDDEKDDSGQSTHFAARVMM